VGGNREFWWKNGSSGVTVPSIRAGKETTLLRSRRKQKPHVRRGRPSGAGNCKERFLGRDSLNLGGKKGVPNVGECPYLWKEGSEKKQRKNYSS